MVLQLAHAIHVVLLLVQLKWVEAVLLLLLVVDVRRRLLLLQLLLSPLQLVVYRLQHVPLLFGFFLLLFLGVNRE
jgi:hypothetical protein